MKKWIASFLAVAGLAVVLSGCAPVTIDTVPSGAEVYDSSGEVLLGTTPYRTRIFHNGKNLIVRKDRYFEEALTIPFDSPPKVANALHPIPVLLRSEPVAAVYPAGSDRPIGRTPMRVSVEGVQSYVLKADGYYDREVTVSIETPDPMSAALDRRPIVTISATPAGVEVFEGGRSLGEAPVVQEILSARTFEFRKTEHFTQTVTLTGAPPYEVTIDLKPFPVITVAASPNSAQILRGGSVIGTGSARLAVGESIGLEVKADRHYAQTVTLTPESPARVQVDLKPMPYVTVQTVPAGAQVLTGGRSLGAAPVELLVERPTAVEVRQEGYVTANVTLTGTDDRVTVRLEKVPEPVAAEVAPAVSDQKPVDATAEPVAEEEAPLTWWQKILKIFGR